MVAVYFVTYGFLGLRVPSLGPLPVASVGTCDFSVGACVVTSPAVTTAIASLSFTLNSGASQCFFRDHTTVTPLSAPVPVAQADPTSGPAVARSSTTLLCPADPSGFLTGLYIPSFSRNLVGVGYLQDRGITVTFPAHGRTPICTESSTGAALATFTREPHSGLFVLHTPPPQVAVSAQVAVSGLVAVSCSCRSLAHLSVFWHHCLGHSSLPRLRNMASHCLVLGLLHIFPSLPPSLAPPCTPCVAGRLRATPHSSSLRLATAPFQTLQLDVWGPAPTRGPERERYCLVVVDDYSRYTTVFPLMKKSEVTSTLTQWLLATEGTRGSRVRCLHSDRGGDFRSGILAGFCGEHGIRQSWTLPESRQQNGVAERRSGLVMNITRMSDPCPCAPFSVALCASLRCAPAEPPAACLVARGFTDQSLDWVPWCWVGLSCLGLPCACPRHLCGQALDSRHPLCLSWFPIPPPPLFLAPSLPPTPAPPVPPPPHGPAPSVGVGGGDAVTGGTRSGDACSRGVGAGGVGAGSTGAGGSGTGGASSGGAGAGGAGTGGASSRGAGAGGSGTGGSSWGAGARGAGTGGASSGGAGAGGACALGAGTEETGAGGSPTALPTAPPHSHSQLVRERHELQRGLRALGLPSSPPIHSQSPTAYGPTFPPPDSTPAVFSPPRSPSPPPVVQHDWTSRCPPRAWPSSPLADLRTVLFRSPPRRSLPVSLLPSPPASSLTVSSHRAARPVVSRVLASLVTDPRASPSSVLALTAAVADFASTRHLDYATRMVAAPPPRPLFLGGESALGCDVLEDKQFELVFLAAASPSLRAMPLSLERDPNALDIPTPRTYREACHLHEEIWLRCPPGFPDTFPPGTLLVYVEELVFATADRAALTEVKSKLQKRHKCTDLGELQRYLGLHITRDRAVRTITLTQSHMVQQVLWRFGFQFSTTQPTPLAVDHRLTGPFPDEPFESSGPYVELVGCLMDGACAWRDTASCDDRCDSSYTDDVETQRSTQGYCFSLGAGAVSWRSTRSSSVASSSAEAEIYAGAMAAQELRWLTFLLADLGEQPRSAPTLYADNKRRGQARLDFVASEANTADVFTKALAPALAAAATALAAAATALAAAATALAVAATALAAAATALADAATALAAAATALAAAATALAAAATALAVAATALAVVATALAAAVIAPAAAATALAAAATALAAAATVLAAATTALSAVLHAPRALQPCMPCAPCCLVRPVRPAAFCTRICSPMRSPYPAPPPPPLFSSLSLLHVQQLGCGVGGGGEGRV
ncbi:unnamed protein product [Closterium sp. NIES-53]